MKAIIILFIDVLILGLVFTLFGFVLNNYIPSTWLTIERFFFVSIAIIVCIIFDSIILFHDK